MTEAHVHATLDHVLHLWHEANELEDEAVMLEDEAKNKHALSEDKLDEAETLWKPLLAEHPEWRGALEDGDDPRAVAP